MYVRTSLAVQTVYMHVRTFGRIHFMQAFLHSVVGLGVGSFLGSFPAMLYNLALHPSTYIIVKYVRTLSMKS